MDFDVPENHRVKLKEGEMKDKCLDLTSELKKKTVEHESDRYTNCNWCSWYNQQRIGRGNGGARNKWTSGNYPKYSIVNISQNTTRSPEDMRRLAVSQTPVKDHQLTQMWKTRKEQNNNNNNNNNEETCCHSNSSEKPSALAYLKNL